MKVIMQEIETIIYFDARKDPQPIRFRLDDDMGEKRTISIDKVNSVRKDKRAGHKALIYDCQAIIQKRLCPLQLIYNIDTYSWFLYKI